MMRLAPLIPCAALFSIAAAPAAAQSLSDLLKTSSPAELAGAFKAMCLDHAGDSVAQAAAAQAAPWLMQAQGRPSARQAIYTGWPLQMHLNRQKSVASCILISAMDDATTTDAVADAALPVLGTSRENAKVSDKTIKWEADIAGVHYFLSFTQFKNPGTVTGAFSIGNVGADQ